MHVNTTNTIQKTKTILPIVFLISLLGYQRPLAQNIYTPPIQDSIVKSEIGIIIEQNEGSSKNNASWNKEEDPNESDYLIAIHKYIIDNEEGSEEICKKLQIEKPELYEKCMKICVLDCYCSLLYHTLLKKDIIKINNKPKHEVISHRYNILNTHKTYLPQSILSIPEVNEILDIYFQSLFPDEKKSELGIYYEVNIWSDLPMMQYISFEHIDTIFTNEQIRLTPEITSYLQNTFNELGTMIGENDIQSIIDQHFQDLKNEYYNLKLQDETKRIINESIAYIARESKCPEILNDDLETLESKIKLSNTDEYYKIISGDNFNALWIFIKKNELDSEAFIDNKYEVFQTLYNYYYTKTLYYKATKGGDMFGGKEFLVGLEEYALASGIILDHSNEDKFATRVRIEEVIIAVHHALYSLYSRQEQGYISKTDLSNKDEVLHTIIEELQLGSRYKPLQYFFTNHILPAGNLRDQELQFQIRSERNDYIEQVVIGNKFPMIPDPEER